MVCGGGGGERGGERDHDTDGINGFSELRPSWSENVAVNFDDQLVLDGTDTSCMERKKVFNALSKLSEELNNIHVSFFDVERAFRRSILGRHLHHLGCS